MQSKGGVPHAPGHPSGRGPGEGTVAGGDSALRKVSTANATNVPLQNPKSQTYH